MRSGKLDRRITIQRKTVTQSASGEPTETWSDVATVWAQQRPVRGDERFSIQQLVGTQVMTFQIRYMPDLTVQDAVSYNGRVWDITDVREVGRHVVTEFDAKARSDT